MNQVNLNSSKILNFKTAQNMQMQQQIPQMQYEQSLPNVQIPQIYQSSISTEEEGIKEKIKKVDIMGLVYPWIEHPFMMLGTCAGLAWGVDKFSAACGGQYETSLVGKAARLGDDIQTSKLVQSKPFQAMLNAGKSAKNKFNKIFKNSDVINALKDTPSQPEWGFVKDELLTMRQRVVHDFSNVTRTLKLTTEGFVELSELGLDKKEYEFIKNFFKGTPVTEEIASNAVQLKRIGLADDAILNIISKPDATNIVKAKQLEKLGVNAAFLEKLEKNPASLRDIVKVRQACEKGRGIRIGAGHQKWLGPLQPFERKIGLDEIGNRLHSTLKGAKTGTGKAFATFLQKCHRGFTFGGGKMGVLFFVSPLLVETMLDVKKAEPNEKVGTAAHGLVHSVSWVFTFPLALSILHRFGGMQYAGMSKKSVEECRKLIKEFNEKANPYEERSFMQKIFGGGVKKAPDKAFQTYDEYKKAKDILKAQLKDRHNIKDQNLLTKICKKVGSFITMDLECISSFKNGGIFSGGFSNIANKLKNICGVPLRVGLWAALTMGVLDTLINKGLKGCFGDHYDRFKEEEFEGNKKEQKKFLKEDLQKRLVEAQTEKVYGTQGLVINEQEFSTPKEIQETLVQEQAIANAKKAEANSKKANTKTNTNTESKTPIENNNNNLEQKVESLNNTSLKENSEVQKINTPASNITKANTGENKNLSSPDTNTYIPSSNATKIKSPTPVKRDNYTYIPSSENLIKKDEKESDSNKYIPSQQGSQFTKTFDNSGLEAALRRADRAEQRAIQTLAGNFNSY